MNDAYGRAEATYGPVDEWFKNDSNTTAYATRFGERMTDFLKVSKNCKATANTGCMNSTNYKTFRGTDSPAYTASMETNNYTYKFILADGASVGIRCDSTSSCAIFIDIDGPNKGKNYWGLDIFDFSVAKTGVYVNEGTPALCYRDAMCSSWVIKNDNMDYLKTDTSGKCPNGTVLSETNTTCK